MHSTTIHVVPIVPDSSKQGCTAPSSVVQKDDVCAVDQYGKCCIAYCICIISRIHKSTIELRSTRFEYTIPSVPKIHADSVSCS